MRKLSIKALHTINGVEKDKVYTVLKKKEHSYILALKDGTILSLGKTIFKEI